MWCSILPAATVLYFLLTNQMYLVARVWVCVCVCIESTHPPTHPQSHRDEGRKGRKKERKKWMPDRVVLGGRLVRDVSNSAAAIVDCRLESRRRRMVSTVECRQFSSVSNRCSIAQHVPRIIIPRLVADERPFILLSGRIHNKREGISRLAEGG